VKKGKGGLVEWQEVALDTIKTIAFTPTSIGTTVAGSTAASPVPQEFATYSDGTRLAVYLSEVVTAQEGKVALDCTTTSGTALKAPLFVLGPDTQ
jgi:hypothetical protein